MKRITLIGGTTLLVIFALFSFRRCGGNGEDEYQTATVTRGAITQAVTATGTLNPVVNVQVGSQISGNIQKLFELYYRDRPPFDIQILMIGDSLKFVRR